MPEPKYLTERSLTAALRDLTGDRWVGAQTAVGKTRHRWDVAFRSPTNQIVLVDYDGDEHYRSTLKIKADIAKDHHAIAEGARVVRFPYWLQLDSRTCLHFFDLSVELSCSFPHGFITTSFFPASFCELGLKRFTREFAALPPALQAEVLASIQARVVEHGLDYVLPSTLQAWAARQVVAADALGAPPNSIPWPP